MIEKYTLKGTVPSKKNSKQISCRGGKPLVRVSKNYKEWHDKAVYELAMQNKDGYVITKCDLIKVCFYVKDKRKRDLDNGLASILDTMVDAGILEDDNYYIVPEIHIRYEASEESYVEIEIS